MTIGGGGGRGPFKVDSFHATPIGIMLNADKFSGGQLSSPPVPSPMDMRHACLMMTVAKMCRFIIFRVTLFLFQFNFKIFLYV